MARLLTLLIMVTALCCPLARSADPTLTHYTPSECEGSFMPYQAVDPAAVPDSLVPVLVNHVGRHGARFPSSDKNVKAITEALDRAEQEKTITPAGRGMRRLCRLITDRTAGQWGALDSLGEAEQRGIATRMYRTFPSLFESGRVNAMSSYSPRCIMSMYSFAHQLSRMNNRLEVYTNSGRQNSALMRPFDLNAEYREFREGDTWQKPLDEIGAQLITDAPLRRILGKDADLGSDAEAVRQLAMAEYGVVACAAAMGIDAEWEQFFTADEYNRLWAVSNMRHYLQYSSSTLTTSTADMAAPLLLDLINTTDDAVSGNAAATALLRFGHAETLMPLLALMHLPGCYYMTNYFDTVALHWRDFAVVPMAANIQLILFRHKDNGRYYVRVDHNERTVPLIPGRSALYTPWEAAREYLMRCLPLVMQ